MKSLKNARYKGSENRESLIDLTIPENFNNELILFIHGYMGYKDWGTWNLLENYFTTRGFGFCKFNFTHNGGTVGNGIDFPDLNAFAENSYFKEVQDVRAVLNWLGEELGKLPKIHLIGHSRGGGIALLSAKDSRISTVTTLAGISSIAQRFSDAEMMENWKKNGVRFVTNQRTKQEMPHNYSQVESFNLHHDELNIEEVCRNLEKPALIIHGSNDTSIFIVEGERIASWLGTDLHIITDADHVFGATQPWNNAEMPEKLKEAAEKIWTFLK